METNKSNFLDKLGQSLWLYLLIGFKGINNFLGFPVIVCLTENILKKFEHFNTKLV